MRQIALDAYLARIGLDARPTADIDGLRTVHRAHRRTIPFENLDIALGRGISLDPDVLFAKLVTARRGGYCFEHNALFLGALEALGFAVRPLLARVWLFADGVPPATHTLTLVTLGGEAWIADAGFGGSEVPPLRLAEGAAAGDGAIRHTLRADPDFGWMLERDGERQYSFTEARVWPVDLAIANHWVATAPASRFVALRIANIVADGGLVSLTGTRLSEGDAEGELDAAGYRAALAVRFGIELSEDEVAALGLFAG